ncbi:MAG: hypothetical protein ACI8TQ_000702 [Planctomycetota bacterium]|jgi:hypothetical protein
MWESNRSVLSDRFPNILAALESAGEMQNAEWLAEAAAPTASARGIQLTSAYDRNSEAREQAQLIDDDADSAWVYGFGLGDLPRELLARTTLKRLNVVLLNCSLTRFCLGHVDNTDWLRDSRVRLLLGSSESEIQSPFAALPGELALADDSSARLRDLVQIELASPWVAEKMNERGERFAAAIAENEEFLAVDGDVAELFGLYKGKTVYVAAAGPSLEESYEFLRDRQAPLIAVGAALRPFLDAGLCPQVVIGIDDHYLGMTRQFESDLSPMSQSALVYFPVVPTKILKVWPGRRLVAYGVHPRWSELDASRPKGRLWGSGTVTHTAIDLAVRMGASRVVLFGCDFGFVDNRTHARGNAYSSEIETLPNGDPLGQGAWVHDVNGNRLATLPNLCSYLRDLERYIAVHPEVEFVNASRSGAAIAGTVTAEEVQLGS